LNNKLPTRAEFTLDREYKQGIKWKNRRKPAKGSQIELEEGDELVRRQDVEQLIKDSMEDYHERINDAKNIPHAWNLALEKLLEDVQNE